MGCCYTTAIIAINPQTAGHIGCIGRYRVNNRDFGRAILTRIAKGNSNSLETLREAAIAGLGLVQLPFYACRQAIAAGLLCTAFDSLEAEPVLLRALTPSGRGLTQAMQNLLDSLQTALSGREGEGILKPPSRR